MKRTTRIAILMILCLTVAVFGAVTFGACVDGNDETGKTFRLVAPDGATALAIASVLADSAWTVGGKEYRLDAQIVSPATIKDEALKSDVAIVPANAAAAMYNGGAKIKVLGAVTNGNLYMIGSQSGAMKLKDLVGKLVYSIGQGSVPDLLFQSMLRADQIEYVASDAPQSGKVAIKYVGQGSDAVSAVMAAKKQGKEAYAIVGEPAVANALAKGALEVFDLQRLWQQHTQSALSGYAQAVLIATEKTCADADAARNIISKFAANAEYLSNTPTEQIVASVKAVYPQSALPDNLTRETALRCNVTFAPADGNAEYIEMTLAAAFAVNPKSIGGKMPSDDFYYTARA